MSAQITIELNDYLSDDEKRSIARDAFRSECQRRSKEDFERILSNAAYRMVRDEVDAVFDGGMVETVKANATKVINGLSAYTVFNRPDAWEREASKGWVHLQASIDEFAPELRKRVKSIMSGLSEDMLRDRIESELVGAIIEKITARESNA